LVIVVAALVVVQRPLFPRIMAITIPVFAILIAVGAFSSQLTWAGQRLDSEQSEESAVSRLPVVYASVRMFVARPVTGWGYENFDRYDRQFQKAVGDLVYPNKDHASHNFYLTTLAEQGVVGLLLFLGPVGYWLVGTVKVLPRMPRSGFISRQLLLSLWLVILGHVIVNNFSRMQVQFGLGMWWVVLGLIASIIVRAGRSETGVENVERVR
jgi:O-antigen ligase